MTLCSFCSFLTFATQSSSAAEPSAKKRKLPIISVSDDEDDVKILSQTTSGADPEEDDKVKAETKGKYKTKSKGRRRADRVSTVDYDPKAGQRDRLGEESVHVRLGVRERRCVPSRMVGAGRPSKPLSRPRPAKRLSRRRAQKRNHQRSYVCPCSDPLSCHSIEGNCSQGTSGRQIERRRSFQKDQVSLRQRCVSCRNLNSGAHNVAETYQAATNYLVWIYDDIYNMPEFHKIAKEIGMVEGKKQYKDVIEAYSNKFGRRVPTSTRKSTCRPNPEDSR